MHYCLFEIIPEAEMAKTKTTYFKKNNIYINH